METLGTAQLAEEIPAARAVTAVVARDEVAGALQDPEHLPELYLDVSRGEEHGSIGISWSHDELEEILARAGGDDILLTFDRDQLDVAFDDVEAHGLRARAIVFAVAATGALGSGATIANAAPILEHSSSGASAGTVQSLAHDSLATESATVSNVRTPGLQIGDAEAKAAASSLHVSARDSVVDAGVTSNVHTPGLQLDEASTGGARSVHVAGKQSGDEFLGVTTRDVTGGLIAGGVLLAIAGATFAGSRRTGTTRPA